MRKYVFILIMFAISSWAQNPSAVWYLNNSWKNTNSFNAPTYFYNSIASTNSSFALGSTDLSLAKVYIKGESSSYTNKPKLLIIESVGATGNLFQWGSSANPSLGYIDNLGNLFLQGANVSNAKTVFSTNMANASSIIAYSSVTNTITIGSSPTYTTLTNVTGNVYLSVTGGSSGMAYPIVVYLSCNATSNPSITFPSGWNWLTTMPTAMTSNATLVISLSVNGSGSNNIQAVSLQQ